MTVYVLMFCFTCKIPPLVPYTPSDCQVISVHKNIECAWKRAWEHCGEDFKTPEHTECLDMMYVETMQVEE